MQKKNMKKEADFNQSQNDENPNISTEENPAGPVTEPAAEDLEIEKLKLELEEQKDKFLRKVAEFENYKRRTAKERMELIQTAGKEVISDMLDVVDDCDRAEKQIETSDNIEKIREGILLVFNK